MNILILNCLSKENNIISQSINEIEEIIKNDKNHLFNYNISDLEIQPCNACTAQYSFEYTEKCRCDDDMNNLYPYFKKSQIWVFVADVSLKESFEYLKNLLDRMEPLFQPINFLDNSLNGSVASNFNLDGYILFLSYNSYHNPELTKKINNHFDSYSLLFNKNYLGYIDLNDNKSENLSKIKDILNKINIQNTKI